VPLHRQFEFQHHEVLPLSWPGCVAGETSQMGMPVRVEEPQWLSHAIIDEKRFVDRGAHSFADFAEQPGLDIENGIAEQIGGRTRACWLCLDLELAEPSPQVGVRVIGEARRAPALSIRNLTLPALMATRLIKPERSLGSTRHMLYIRPRNRKPLQQCRRGGSFA
jgi:hypothetical protein